jgi:5'-3' exoribonuclease 2
MAEGTSLLDHIDEFNSIISDLESIDVVINEVDAAIILLCSLSSSYSSFRERFLYEKDTVTVNDIKSALNSKNLVDRSVTGSVNERSGEALVVKGAGSSKSKNRDKTCFYCKRKGHIKEDCWRWKNKVEKDQDKHKPGDVNVAEDDSDAEYALTTVNGMHFAYNWIMDSGCSFHMCPNRDWFSTYKSVDDGSVLMSNNTACKILGIGTVRIKLHDGVVRTLTNVRHIFGLKKNLISLGTLDEKGYRISAYGGTMKVNKGAKTIMEAKRQSPNLYMLLGVTVKDTTSGEGDLVSRQAFPVREMVTSFISFQ